jgi:hypothetical protein
MLMRTELPSEHRRWRDVLAKELLMLAVFAVIGVVVAVGLAIAFPIWFAQLPG